MAAAEASPLYRSGSVADETLNRAENLARRAKDILAISESRLAGVAFSPPPVSEPSKAKVLDERPPFFAVLNDHLGVMEDVLDKLGSLMDRAAL